MEVYLNGIQTGYVVGIEVKGRKYDLSFYRHPSWPTSEEINLAYHRASLKASILKTTLTKRPDIIRRRIKELAGTGKGN